MIASLLELNSSKDFIIFNTAGKIIGLTEKIFYNIKEKFYFLNQNKKNNLLKKDDFLEQCTISMLFPRIHHIIRNFLLTILSCNKDSKNEEVSSEKTIIKSLLQNKINELIVTKNDKTLMSIRSDLTFLYEYYTLYLQDLGSFKT